MNTIIKILFLCGIIVFAACSHKKDDTTNPLIGSWKCLGFGNTQTGTFEEIEPKDCDKCYTLNFKEDGTITGHTSTNNSSWKYNINSNEIKIHDQFSTDINELYNGWQYVEAILKVHTYEINEQGDLLLYYENENNYLIFKSV